MSKNAIWCDDCYTYLATIHAARAQCAICFAHWWCAVCFTVHANLSKNQLKEIFYHAFYAATGNDAVSKELLEMIAVWIITHLHSGAHLEIDEVTSTLVPILDYFFTKKFDNALTT